MTKHTDPCRELAPSSPLTPLANEPSDQAFQREKGPSSDETHSWFTADSIVDTVREPLLVLSADLRVRKANRSFYRTFQVSPEETEGRLIYDLGNQQWDIPWLRKLLEEVLPKDTAFDDFEVEHVFPAIGRKFMLLNARRICRKDNQTEFILLAIEDTTERRLAEEARLESESRYSLLVKNIKDHSIFMMDLEGNITSWNAEAEQIIGYALTEIVGRNFSELFTPEDLQTGMPGQELRLARENGRAEDERWHVRKDGSRFWALGIVTPMQDAGGNLNGFSKILRDMTERKCAELKLQEQAEALKQADRSKNEFLATLAHELRNPLAPILHALHILRQNQTASPLLQQARNTAELQVRNMVRLIDDLLDASRITTGKIQVHKQGIDMRVIVERAVETARPQIDGGKHKLSVSLPPEPLWLEADPTRLEQIIANLLNNAAKYTEPGGSLWLTAKRDEKEAVITVRDTGIGIAQDFLPLVFNLFIQADGSIDRRQGGLGIGLSLVRRLAELHGGKVTASSAGLGKGSEFTVRLPCMEGTLPEKTVPSPDLTKPTGRPLRVLMVEDNINAAEMLSALLGMSGHEVLVAHTGAAALDLAIAFRPEVILLDINLPGMNGFEVAKRLRAQPGLEKVLIVAVTGYGQEKDERRCRETGFDHHLVKPVDPARLEALLGSVSPHSGQA